MERPVDERHEARAELLHTLRSPDSRGQTIDLQARAARQRLWITRPGAAAAQDTAVTTGTENGVVDGEIALRAGLLLLQGNPKSPLMDGHAPRSKALQLLLVALFAAHCRRPASYAGRPTPLPLRDPDNSASTSWRYLVAMPTIDTGTRTTASRSPLENRLEQLRAALRRLHTQGRIELSGTGRGRFERFRLLDESTYRPDQAVPYKLPKADEPVVRVPVGFFLNGWVHALSGQEIAAYLYLLYLQQNMPLEEDGLIAVPRLVWAEAFGGSRAHIGYRMLFRFGLIRMRRQDIRRDDGTIEDIAEHGYIPFEPMRFAVDVDQLHADALDRVLPALERASKTRLDDAWTISRGLPTGLDWAAAVTGTPRP